MKGHQRNRRDDELLDEEEREEDDDDVIEDDDSDTAEDDDELHARFSSGSFVLSGSPLKPKGPDCDTAREIKPCRTAATPAAFDGLPLRRIYSAAAPATCGEAILVPLIVA